MTVNYISLSNSLNIDTTIYFIYSTNNSTLTPEKTISIQVPHNSAYVQSGQVITVHIYQNEGYQYWYYDPHNYYFQTTVFGQNLTSNVIYGGGSHTETDHTLLLGTYNLSCTITV